ncbi:MAG: hypothetical protein KKE46_05175 [Gammaproteobacteria bacterium]|nr:hypothetical protein [Gammaproteobacteria bacterium]
MLQGSNQRDLTSLNPEETNECIDFCIASLEEISSKDGITNSHHWIHQMLSALTTLRNAQRSSSDASFLQMYLMQIFINFRLDRVESYSKQADVQEIDEATEKATQATQIVSENCYLTAFCEEFFYRFIQQSTTFLVVSSGAVSTKLGKSAYPIHSVEFVTPAVETISHLLHIPVISAFTKAGTAFLEKGVMKLMVVPFVKTKNSLN